METHDPNNFPGLSPVKDSTRLSKTPSLNLPEEQQCGHCFKDLAPNSASDDTSPSSMLICTQCRGMLYCSAECFTLSNPTHKKLCRRYGRSKTPKDNRFVRAIHFPAHTAKPAVVIVRGENWYYDAVRMAGLNNRPDNRVAGVSHTQSQSQYEDDPFQNHQQPTNGNGNSLYSSNNVMVHTITHSHLSGNSRALPATLKVICLDRISPTDPVNKSVVSCCKDGGNEDDKLRHSWHGDIVVVRMNKSVPGYAASITMGDFRDALDFFAWYGKDGESKELQEQLQAHRSHGQEQQQFLPGSSLHTSDALSHVAVTPASAVDGAFGAQQSNEADYHQGTPTGSAHPGLPFFETPFNSPQPQPWRRRLFTGSSSRGYRVASGARLAGGDPLDFKIWEDNDNDDDDDVPVDPALFSPAESSFSETGLDPFVEIKENLDRRR